MEKYHLNNRPDREITDPSEIKAILKNGKFCTISLCRANEPYIVTLSYGYDQENEDLYFHCSAKGLKIDFIMANPDVCATVIEDGGYEDGRCEHNYRTVVFRGVMSIAGDLEEKRYGMQVLLNHLEKKPEVNQDKLLKSELTFSKMNILRLHITVITGKAGK